MSTPGATAREPGCLATLFWGAAFVVLVDAAVLGVNAAMMPYSGGGGLFGGWMLSLLLLLVCVKLVAKGLGGGGGLLVGIVAFAVFSLVFEIMGGRIYKLGGVKETPVIAVSEADQPAHASCDVFHFSDGKVDRKHYGLRDVGGRRRRIYYYVAPIVPEGWTESDPVTAWAAAEVEYMGHPGSWGQPLRGGYREGLDTTTFKELVEETARNRHLVTRANAPILRWDARPREALESSARAELWGLLAVDAVVLVGLLFPFFVPKTRRA